MGIGRETPFSIKIKTMNDETARKGSLRGARADGNDALPAVSRRTFLHGLTAVTAATVAGCESISPTPAVAVGTNAASVEAELQNKPAGEDAPLAIAGNRQDKQTVGHGKNVALYTGNPSRFWYATYGLENVFSAADGATIAWYPDQILLSASRPGNEHGTDIAPAVDDVRSVCVTKDDVAVSVIRLTNRTDQNQTYKLEIKGDCRGGADWRDRPGGVKETRLSGDGAFVLLTDKNVFPEFLPNGLSMAIGGTMKPSLVETSTPGAYRMVCEVTLAPYASRTATFVCAFDRDAGAAEANARKALAQKNPVVQNRKEWEGFYDSDVPRFSCSDGKLNELYDFRWFLLRISTAGGNLGLFRYPVVMEGRQAFQTYCCYSAPFMAFDMNWATDPSVGYGHIANMGVVSYEDGRFPWYASPRTNHVPLDHDSKTGLSALPMTAWRWYQIHGDKEKLVAMYPWMKKNMDWWISDRDPDKSGLFEIDHQLETGMDDLHRRWKGKKPARYQAIDATCYAYANLRAVENMARELGKTNDAQLLKAYADKSLNALNTILWSNKDERWLDRNRETGELSDYQAITMFYPLFADMATRDQLGVVKRYLTNPDAFWLPHPLPAISKADPEFDPVKRYWAGPSWPAATSHVIEGFALTAKQHDRSLMPQAAELLHRAVNNHFTPRVDFYERYDPFSGKPLSGFRDYMHSWWIDIFIRHVAGLTPQNDGTLVIDPLPMGLTQFSLTGAPHRGNRVDVLYNDAKAGKGLVVRVNGKIRHQDPAFVPGASAKPVRI